VGTANVTNRPIALKIASSEPASAGSQPRSTYTFGSQAVTP
jgi:hypothetical protein